MRSFSLGSRIENDLGAAEGGHQLAGGRVLDLGVPDLGCAAAVQQGGGAVAGAKTGAARRGEGTRGAAAPCRSQAKKRHVKEVTCLPTKRMATACWDFIVAKTIPPEAAPVLVFGPLRVANKEICQQLINSLP